MEDYAKIYWAGLKWGTVEYNIEKQEFYLPKELCSGDQVSTKEFAIRKPVNEVDHLRIECRVFRGQ